MFRVPALSSTLRFTPDIIDANGIGDVLDSVQAQIVESAVDLSVYLLMDAGGNRDAALLGETFEPRGDIHAVAVDLLPRHQDITEIDADAILHPFGLG